MQEEIDLKGTFCPYPVVNIIKKVEAMSKGETLSFVVDDPLCIKSTPEELSSYTDIDIDIKRIDKGWKITITKE